ncbi:S-layer homology domain-containing protein [Lyngbya sp. CCY1209]|uniref:S-layer homology domain-containing protein n=1 Tax=Lyngbya sp. CCY1209 TaxID=2886103 RepID=UPI002D2042C9|nr:S-layer homology domain-containing protein [Lyngbya sp. CCY1209]MEB3883568.1 S-layer homology domain-containing protein [Lyngbya sp. CCY1209]
MSQSNPPDLPKRQDLPPMFDEWVAIILAIATMGFIFFWSFGKVDPRLSLNLFRATPTPTLEGGGSTQISDLIEDVLPSRTSSLLETDRDSEPEVSDRSRTASVAPSGAVVSAAPLLFGRQTQTTSEAAMVPKSPEASPEPTAAVPLVPLESPPGAETPDAETAATPPASDSETVDEGAIATPASPDAASEAPTSETQTTAVPLVPLESPPGGETPDAETETAATPPPSDVAEAEDAETETAATPPPSDVAEAEDAETAATAPEVAQSPDETTPILANVPEDHWARGFITYFADQNQPIGVEDGSFQPDEPLTRSQFANQLQRSFEREDVQPDINFKDLPEDYWANPAIRDVTKRGFLKGYPGEVFRPDQQMTQVEVVVALASGFDLTPPENPQEVLKTYADADQIPEWAVGKVAAATQAGLVVDHPDRDTFNPNEPVTQAEAIAMIYQSLVKLGEVEPIESEYIVNP